MPTREANATWEGGLKNGKGSFRGQSGLSGAYSFASRFGMTTGELIDAGIQILAAIQSLPAAPTAQGEVSTDVENLLTYETALWQHAKRDEQLRTLGNLLVRILK